MPLVYNHGVEDFFDDGLNFSCERCGSCCAGKPGVVFMSREELYALAEHEGLGVEQFIKVFCRWMEADDGTKFLSLRETSGYECIFWNKDTGCSVYSLRPVQCRTYPFWSDVMRNKNSWDREKEKCPGINCGTLHGKREIMEQLALYGSRNPVTDGTEL